VEKGASAQPASNMEYNVFDIEGDGLEPTKIHCLAAEFKGKVRATTDYEKMRSFLKKAKVLVGHNIIRFDIPVLERLLGIKIKAKFVDTLALSWYLYPERIKHGLEGWGEDFGVPKPPIDDWDNLPIEEYINRCSEDVKINLQLWQKQWKYLLDLYGSEGEAWHLIDYLMFKMDCAREQERSRWKVDVEKAKAGLEELKKEYDEKYGLLQEAMPKVPVKAYRNRPAKPYKKDGTYSVAGAKWFALCRKQNLPEDYVGQIEEVVRYDEPNPSSNDQIKEWLYSLGWEPQTFKYVMDEATREFRKIPQVRKEAGGEKVLCHSVTALIPKEPALEYLKGVTVLAHRMAILEGFLKAMDKDGYIKAEIGGLTNTLRFKHRVAVNLPGVDKPYGKLIRGVLVAPDGYELCGSDMSSLEDRTKQHFMWDHDPEYVKEMNTPDFDPHLDIALVAKMMTKEEVDAYKAGDHAKKPVRHKAKTANYACTYGVTPAGLVRNTGMPLKDAELLHTAYWRRNWSIKAIADNCRVRTVRGQKWLYNPVSGIWHSLRHEKDRFSTLNQGTGTYCFDKWVRFIRSKRPQLTATFHDEVVLCVKKGYREECTKLLKWAVQEVNKSLKLNRDLDVDVNFGDSYADVH
jgi:hypothetical protein